MGDLPEIGRVERREETIAVAPHWSDHHVQGRAVLPAVEAMRLMADWVSRDYPAIDVRTLRAARFDKFLPLRADSPSMSVFCDISQTPGSGVRVALASRVSAKTARMSRTVVHAQVDFKATGDPEPPSLLAMTIDLAGPCCQVTPERIYADLVPFGPAYRNIVRPLCLAADGVLAQIQAPRLDTGPTDGPLGSPFVLDAAFHAACVWGQYFVGLVAFPVGIAQRRVLRPTQAGETYVARIFPRETDGPVLLFDAWIVSLDGRPCEVVEGIQMRAVPSGRLQPPGQQV